MRVSISLLCWIGCLILSGCSSLASATSLRQDDTCSVLGYELQQKQGKTITITKLSPLGSEATQYDMNASRKPIRGAIVRYADRQVFGLDYDAHEVVVLTLDAAVQLQQEQHQQLFNVEVPESGVRIGKPPLPTIEELPIATKIRDVVVRQYVVHDFGSNRIWRLSFANDLPLPPHALRQKLAQMQSFTTLGRGDDGTGESIAERVAGRALLRTEVETPNGWSLVIDTTQAKKVHLPCSTYDPPVGWRQVPTPPTSKSGANLPTGPGMSAPSTPSPTTTANVISGPGPWLKHPEVYLYFWGKTFADPSHEAAVLMFVESMKAIADPAYATGLAQYDSAPPKLIFHRFVSEDPNYDVGYPNTVGAIGGFVLTQGLSTDAPLFWWRLGGHDPLYVVLVPEAVVDKSHYNGMHWLAPNLVGTSVPFPFNFFVYEGMPWVMVKVPEDGLGLPAQGLLDRYNCDRPRWSYPVVSDLCGIISKFDEGTTRISHEYVEAASDPFPFWGYSDTGKYQVWEYGEIADICKFASPSWGDRSAPTGAVLATYWSQIDGACIPNSRPSIAILQPTNGDTLAWQTNGAVITAQAYATDPIDGQNTPLMTPNISWYLDDSDTSFAKGDIVSTPRISLGTHTLTAHYVDSQPAQMTATATVAITVSATAPVATITRPADGATFAADDAILLRGNGFDYQDGALKDPQLVWTDNGTLVGTGHSLPLTGESQGTHALTLTVTNSANISSSASVTIVVGPPAGNPTVTITSPADAGPSCQSQGGVFSASGNITFVANARDGSGAAIPDANVSWKLTNTISGIETTLGTGNTLTKYFTAGNSIDVDKVAVTVAASGKSASDSIYICVGHTN